MDSLLFCFLLVLASLLFLFFKKKERRGRFPPGPKGYPLVGNLFDVDFASMYKKFDEWATEYGDIFCVNIFGRNLFVLNSGAINREAFLQEPNATILADRIEGMVGKDFFYYFPDISFARQNETTIKRRKLGFRLMKAYGEDHEKDGTINAEDTINGRHYDDNSEFVFTLRELDHQLTIMMHPWFDMLFHLFPFIRYIPCKPALEYKRAKNAQNKFFALLREEANKHPEDKGVYQDLLEAQKTERNKKGELWILDEDINGIMTNFVTAVMSVLKQLSRFKDSSIARFCDVQKRLQEEVDTIVWDDELPSLNNRSEMPYTEAVIMETLRVISHAPLSLPHGASKHTTLRGYEIPKDAMII
ncbi:hypothetical protein KUTeg_014144 [Tegillarca granosa]|uniref:Cytochrome P450 n=1 Tax=Tegillarca granosa TaxID=220873 RepID=A0ABQ9F0Y4_TEGGR|nr:hypothetical protein KUTeg_014144 [Tegillarca granosa]